LKEDLVNYGFVIDNRKCIGCHACSTACKSENEVPLGVYRTWVKYVETGVFPNNRRHFQVTRCNHCANPPCVRICPVTAMYQREDGIVDFDADVCIGCKACMQACPYDAIYIDPETRTAAKCHYCAHRTEIGLEPACAVVCPEQAIIAGDMDDTNSKIAQLLTTQDVTVRKPAQGTSPKVFYIDGNDVALVPTAVERTPQTFMWADVIPLHEGEGGSDGTGVNGNGTANAVQALPNKKSHSGAALRAPQPQGTPWDGPIQFGASMAEHMVQVSYNAQHKIPWHWPVPAYLVTKGIGAGIFMILSLGLGLSWFAFDSLTVTVAGFLSLLFIGVTTALLVFDLEKPERFVSIMIRPQWRSWLTRGAFILVGFTIVAGIWWLVEAGAHFAILPADVATTLRPLALWLGLPLAIGAAIYTAYLFSQAEGRDLWQSSLLPAHLLIQSFMVGSGLLLIVATFLPDPPDGLVEVAWTIFIVALILDLFVALIGEFSIPHASEVAAQAAHEISHGHYRKHFWWGSVALGHAAPLALALVAVLLTAQPFVGAIAGLCAITGLYLFEYAFVMAPQEVPNS
jgi:Fe-S-cluster-containing dehydrogenase component/formate-dependent nitrite reductase membrane component NrfD